MDTDHCFKWMEPRNYSANVRKSVQSQNGKHSRTGPEIQFKEWNANFRTTVSDQQIIWRIPVKQTKRLKDLEKLNYLNKLNKNINIAKRLEAFNRNVNVDQYKNTH